ncbi:polysaccharide biosynthesis tyrosine autokinase [Algisphaera agarilytica]|uniref:Capsular exopolysaccharide synthesis family protein n=1 Tax=Algisphaera agarilytica TaxID=1385975 RepID=A0A7X0LK61_9BACT|nr:polysaccharide biosynthesis tyrosine autokinase [Algisphaera agarilytica]MBB6429301.1 capsular exopolysaccharide synthesis family protein [Algisphaera agarilytica]
MTPPPPVGRLKPVDPVRLLRQHYKLMLVAGTIGLMIGVGLYVGLRKTSPQYTSEAQLLVETRTVTDPFAPTVGDSASARNTDVASYMANESNFILSDEIIRDTLVRPRAQSTAWLQSFKGDSNRAREEMQESMLQVNPLRGTTLINLAMTAPNPGDAQVLLDEVMATYLNRKKLINDQAGSALRNLFLGETNRYEDDIRSIRNQMARFIRDNEIETLGLAASEEQMGYNLLLQEQFEMAAQLTATQGSYESLKASASNPEMTDEENAYLQTIPQIASREEEIRTLDESRRQLIASGLKDNHPQIKQLDNRRDSVEYELKRETEKQLGELRALQIQTTAKAVEGLMVQLTALEPQLSETKTRLQELTQKLNEYAALEIDLQIVIEKKQRADAALDTLRTISNRDDYVRVKTQVSPSEPELTFPKLIIVPAVTMLAVGLIGGLMVLREMLDQRVRSPQDLKLLPIESNLLGLIPHSNEDPSGGGSAERTVERSPTGLLTESYRQVRTAVLSKMDRRGYKTLVCVAAQPGSGTSTVIQNLAASLAYNGRDVLIIDANFRRPSQHKLMDCGNSRGLVDVLKDDVDVADVIVQHPDMSMSVLPTGRASDSPPELLEGAAFRGLLGQLETEYDVVLIDTPPALLTSDSQMLSKHVDAIAVIVNAGSDKRGMLGRMLNQLDGQRADVLGIVLNGVKSSAGGYFRKSYEDFYRYRQSESSTSTNGKPKKEKAAKAKKGRKLDKDGSVDRNPIVEEQEAPTAVAEIDELDIDLDFPDDDLKA